MKKNSEKKSVSEKWADSMEFPKDVVLDIPRIEFIGNTELTIENYKGILEYTDSIIRIAAKLYNLKIEGINLEIKTITQDMLYICGKVVELKFQKGGNDK